MFKTTMVAPHKKIQKHLSQAIEKGRIAHALLFNGDCGHGSVLLAHWYATRLLSLEKNKVDARKIDELNHADYHFCFPVTDTSEFKKPSIAELMPEWRSFFHTNPCGSFYDWMKHLDVEKKQGIINVRLAKEIIQTLMLRSYEGGYRVMMIWLPETMNAETANKLLKLIEEPPEKTVFLLITEEIDRLLPTLVSRCQVVDVPMISTPDMEEILVEIYGVDPNLAGQVIPKSMGNVQRALENLLVKNSEFETYFVQWVRSAFSAKKNAKALQDILDWSVELSRWSRERQKQFLLFASDTFRQALMQSYGAGELVYSEIEANGFKWKPFSRYIHGANIPEILEELNQAIYHIERNGNAKIIFLDLGIKLTRFIHKSAA